MNPDRLLSSVLLTAAALMACLCGLCTLTMVGWTAPPIITKASDAPYAWMFLIPSLLIGGCGVLLGGWLFHRGRSIPRKPDRIDVVASALTAIGGGLYVLVFAGLAALSASFVWVGASSPYGLGSEIVFPVLWTVAFAAATFGCLKLLLAGLRRFRKARAALAGAVAS